MSLGAPEVLDLLREGRLEVEGRLEGASNLTFLARVEGPGRAVPAVYKPRAGEAPLWDFPDGSLAGREVAAYLVAAELGWPNVPPTVLRDGPLGPGAVQLFVEADPREHFFSLREERLDEFGAVAVFDALVNNADRKGGHCLLGADGRIWVVDHGLCFHEEPKLRTVIWDFAGEPIPGELRAALGRLGARSLATVLSPLLAPEEVRGTEERLAGLLASGRFPLPGPGRPVPWPPI